MTTYLLDANVFIQAKRLHYGFDFCPAFWDWIVAQNSAGSVYSIEKVGDELLAGGDDLATWTGGHAGIFLKPDTAVVASLQATSKWANAGGFDPAAVTTFLQVADYFLIAHAHAHGHVVVTHEIAATTIKRIKIPNACIALGIKVVSPFEMLRTEKARFVL